MRHLTIAFLMTLAFVGHSQTNKTSLGATQEKTIGGALGAEIGGTIGKAVR